MWWACIFFCQLNFSHFQQWDPYWVCCCYCLFVQAPIYIFLSRSRQCWFWWIGKMWSSFIFVCFSKFVSLPVTFSPRKKSKLSYPFVFLLWHCSPSSLKILAIGTFWWKTWNHLTSRFSIMCKMKNGVEIHLEYLKRYVLSRLFFILHWDG